jgi:protein phosphatase PTC2/3
VFTIQGSEESNGAPSVSVEMLRFVPNIRSGSFSDIGPRRYMEDEHIRIDDLSAHLGPLLVCPLPSAFYGVRVLSVYRWLIQFTKCYYPA